MFAKDGGPADGSAVSCPITRSFYVMTTQLGNAPSPRLTAREAFREALSAHSRSLSNPSVVEAHSIVRSAAYHETNTALRLAVRTFASTFRLAGATPERAVTEVVAATEETDFGGDNVRRRLLQQVLYDALEGYYAA